MRALVFLGSAVIVVTMGESRRRHNEKLRNEQGELEKRVSDRTADLDTANQNLRELSARLLQLQDDERRRIARELHDSVGQMLVALTMNLIKRAARRRTIVKTAHALADSENLVQEMSSEVRTISHLLHPPLLDEAGLLSALRWYVEGFSRAAKSMSTSIFRRTFGRLPRESETAIFRVVQECLTNIHRHSGSSVAKIRVRQRDREVLVEIEDKGKGIPPEKIQEMASAGAPGVGIRACESDSGSWAARWRLTPTRQGRSSRCASRSPMLPRRPPFGYHFARCLTGRSQDMNLGDSSERFIPYLLC